MNGIRQECMKTKLGTGILIAHSSRKYQSGSREAVALGLVKEVFKRPPSASKGARLQIFISSPALEVSGKNKKTIFARDIDFLKFRVERYHPTSRKLIYIYNIPG
ncbi:hypothetical protein TWF569_000869 [Orbilia oligospora]|nr:hypothetical protein TWF569_000869 [Orbilia oligospora]